MSNKHLDFEKIPDTATVGKPEPGEILLYANSSGVLHQVDENGTDSEVAPAAAPLPQDLDEDASPTFANVNVSMGVTDETVKAEGLITMASFGLGPAPLTNPVSGSTTHTLYSLPVGTFIDPADPTHYGTIAEVELEIAGIFAANANLKRIRLQLQPDTVSPAALFYDSGSVAQNGGSFHIRAVLSPAQEFGSALNTFAMATFPAASTMNRITMTPNVDPAIDGFDTLVQVILTGVAVSDVEIYNVRLRYVPSNVPMFA